MRVSEIQSLYRDENNLLRTVRKQIYEAACPVESLHRWLILSPWEFQSEVWVYTRKPVDSDRPGHAYDHDSEVELLDAGARFVL